MRLALVNLDTGFFLEKDGWTVDLKLAQTFPDPESVAGVAAEKKVKNAAATMIDGNPPQAKGFLWASNYQPTPRPVAP